jgi:hypothetical protein
VGGNFNQYNNVVDHKFSLQIQPTSGLKGHLIPSDVNGRVNEVYIMFRIWNTVVTQNQTEEEETAHLNISEWHRDLKAIVVENRCTSQNQMLRIFVVVEKFVDEWNEEFPQFIVAAGINSLVDVALELSENVFEPENGYEIVSIMLHVNRNILQFRLASLHEKKS